MREDPFNGLVLVEIGIVFGFERRLSPVGTQRENQVALSSGFVGDFYLAMSVRAYEICRGKKNTKERTVRRKASLACPNLHVSPRASVGPCLFCRNDSP